VGEQNKIAKTDLTVSSSKSGLHSIEQFIDGFTLQALKTLDAQQDEAQV
jgi:hypothetical protein